MNEVDVLNPEHVRALYEKIGVLPRAFSGISERAREKARIELNEKDDKMVEKSLKNLRSMLTVKDGWLRNLNDDLLIRFLRVRKFDLLKTLTLLRNFHHFHVRYPKMVACFSIESIKPAMDDLISTCLPYRTSEGCSVGIGKMNWNTETTSFVQLMQLMLVCFETEIQNPMTQICGCISIVDLRGIGWNQVRQFTPANLRCYFTVLQNTFPLRLKEMHIIYSSKLFGIIVSVTTPFLGEKLKARIKFHGENMSSLHKHIPPEILPAEFGGHLGPSQDFGFYDDLRKTAPTFRKLYND